MAPVARMSLPEEALAARPLRVLLVEDDDGDAVLVEDLLEESAAPFTVQHVRTLAVQWLDWKNLGPIVARNKALIEKEVEADTRKLESYDEFRKVTADAAPAAEESKQPAAEEAGRPVPSGREPMSLRTFADKRRAYLLKKLGELESGK